jgi:hypothetical protein
MLLLAGVPASGSDWPMFGRDATRNAVSTERNPPTHWQIEERENGFLVRPAWNIKWAARLGSSTFASPVVAGGLVWIGANNDQPRDPKIKDDAAVLMCFRESDGKFLWQGVSPRLANTNLDASNSGLNCAPLVEGDHLWFVTNRCEVVCLDIGPLRAGKGVPRQLWKRDMRNTAARPSATTSTRNVSGWRAPTSPSMMWGAWSRSRRKTFSSWTWTRRT